jgi:2-(1,2-epoxy-1,2-dihydrophenyl)acetyl-CoA isomerase
MPAQRRMREVFYDAARDPSVRVVMLTGAGPVFCAGGDVRMFGKPDPGDELAQRWAGDPAWSGFEARVDRLNTNVELASLLHGMGKPTIAMVRGVAAGAGMSLALACDFRIGSQTAAFMTSFVKIGASGDFGGSYFLTHLVGPAKAKELYMLGDRVDAQQALQLGLFNRIVADSSLETEAYAFAHRLAKAAPIALRYIKENINAAIDEPFERFLGVESRNMIQTLMTEDSKEAVAAFQEKRDPVFKGR